MLIIIAIATFLATLLGGLFALKFKDRLHLILGFSAGAVIGVAFFDLIPESLQLIGTGDISRGILFVAIGFVAYMLLDRFVVLHSHHAEEVPSQPHNSNETSNLQVLQDHNHGHNHGHSHMREKRGILGAGSLSVHSFLDGIAIGLAFQVSPSVGAIVTLAVLAHDFSDGINTVSMILRGKGGPDGKGDRKLAFKFLLADAIAPVLGIIATCFFKLPETALGIILAIFAGFFLYIGASDLLPESHHNHPTVWTTCMTILGMAVLFAVVRIAG